MAELDDIKKSETPVPPPAPDLSVLEIPYHDPKVFEGIMKTLKEDVIPFDDTERAIWFRLFWLYHVSKHAGCKDIHAEQFREYMHAAVLAGFVAFNRLDESDQVDLVREHLLTIFEIPGYSLTRKIEIRLLLFPHIPERDALREKIREAILANMQILGTAAGPQAVVKPLTVGGMTRSYLASLPPPESGDGLTRQHFINQDGKMKDVPQDVREKCKVILEIFDWVSLSSFSDEGFEEHFSIVENGRRMLIRNGRIEDPIDDDTRRVVEEMIHAGAEAGLWDEEAMYRKPPLLQPDYADKILEEEHDVTSIPPWERGRVLSRDLEKKRKVEANLKRLEEEYQMWQKGSDVARFCHSLAAGEDAFNVLYDGINRKNPELVIPALVSLASSGRMHQEFNSQDRYHVYWGKRVQEQRKDAADAFEVSPGTMMFMAPFIRHVLTERLQISEKDALMIGVMLSNLARTAGEEEYATMAYGDLNAGEFKWNENISMFG